MTSFTESVVEQAALGWLESVGWAVKYGPEIGPGGQRPRGQLRQYDCAHLERIFSGVVRRTLRIS
ncbi:hypothetical protein CLG94_07030 [Candidatus Methylomirabilis limnetica]|uniref:Uncharacterized protein n=1 Tax=Candidatus Methylomirabilis limnetica TaxID=2033718 RepID=A0A2T4TY54_9BACT|nr:hypothetical protein CLG94_07030 [Candidatus Methylomirabilis limnetica]